MIPHNPAIDDLMSKTFDGLAPLEKPRFCNSGCRESYRADRKVGLIYGSVKLIFDDDSWTLMGSYDSKRWTRTCPYCGANTHTKKELKVIYDS